MIDKLKLLMHFKNPILWGTICAVYGFNSDKFQTVGIFLLILGGILTGFIFDLTSTWTKKMQTSVISEGYEYISNFKLFRLPIVHICIKSDEPHKQAKGIIAIGGNSIGVVSIGGLATGIVSVGGVSIGLISFGGLSLGFLLSLGGIAAGFITMGGVAVGQFVTGGVAYALQLLSVL